MSHSPFRHIGSVFWKRNPIQLTFFLTRRCNARCSFCFYLSDKNSAEELQSELSLQEIEKISSSLGRLLWLAFSGGEIFLRDDIVDITKLFYERNKPSIILFPTNGLLPEVIKEKIVTILNNCSRSTIAVKLSLDGPENIHDALRGRKGSFRKTMQTYEMLGELIDVYPNFELGINIVFCSKNQDHIGDVIEFVRRLSHIKTHTVSLIREAIADRNRKDINMETYHKTIEKLASNLRTKISGMYRFHGAKLKAAQDILQRSLIYETMKHKRQMIPCYAGKLNLVLTESGDVYPCESFTMKLGNVRKDGYNMMKIVKNQRAQKIIRSIDGNGCFCTHECYLMTNILFNPKLYPLLAQEYMRLSRRQSE